MISLKPQWKRLLGQKLEQFSHDVFDAFRWIMSVGIARFVAVRAESTLFLWVSYSLSIVLLIFLVSVFLLRGEVLLFRQQTRAAVLANMALNLTICFAVFASCLWLTYAMVEVFVAYQESNSNGR